MDNGCELEETLERTAEAAKYPGGLRVDAAEHARSMLNGAMLEQEDKAQSERDDTGAKAENSPSAKVVVFSRGNRDDQAQNESPRVPQLAQSHSEII